MIYLIKLVIKLTLKMGLKDFVLLGKLGEGTFATVYKARRLSDQNLYAIKKVTI